MKTYCLFVTRTHVSLCSETKEVTSFEQSESGLVAFSNTLQAYPSSRFLLVANLPEETLMPLALPLLKGSARRDFLAKKANALLGEGAFFTTLSSGIVGEGAIKKESLALLGFPASPLFLPWHALLLQSPHRLLGVTTFSLLTQLFLKHQPQKEAISLVLTGHGNDWRQSFFHEGRLVLTRMVRIEGDLATLLLEELRAVYYYLQRKEATPLKEGEHLPLLFLTHDQEAAKTLAAHLENERAPFRLSTHFLKLGIPAALFALAKELPASFYVEDKKTQQQKKARLVQKSIIAFGAALLGASWLLGGIFYRIRQHAEEEIFLTQQAIAKAQSRYERERAAFSPLPEALAQKPLFAKAFLAAVSKELPNRLSPKEAYRRLGAVLENWPDIQMTRLVWQAEARTEKLLLEGVLQNASQEGFDAFLRALQKTGFFVSISASPFHVDDRKTLEGKLLEESPPAFALSLEMRGEKS